MYESFYNLTARPFAPAPVAERYFAAEAIEAARQTIKRNIERAAGPSLLIGPSGTGKSQLCHVLASELKDQFQVVMLASAQLCTRRALLKNILFELDLPYHDREEGELRLALIDHLKRSDACPQGVLMLVDEAHVLPLRLLEELRMITNLVQNGRSCVSLVLAGGSRLENRFADPRLESFSQRLAARCYLQALNSDELRRYIAEQLGQVGAQAEQVFADNAYAAIYQATGGVPRVVNQLCDHAMVLASMSGRTSIDARGIDEAWADLQQLPAPWNEDVDTEKQSAIIEFGPLSDDEDAGHEIAFSTIVPPNETTGLPESTDLDELADLHETTELDAVAPVDNGPLEISPTVEIGIVHPEDEGHDHETVIGLGAAAAELEQTGSPTINPFGEEFEEEEVIIDHYASLDADVRQDRPLVSCDESHDILSQLHSEIDAIAVPPTILQGTESVLPVVTDTGGSSDSELDTHEESPILKSVPFTTTDVPLENPEQQPQEQEPDDSHLLNEQPETTLPTDVEDPVVGSYVDSIADVNFLDSLPATDLSGLYTESESTVVSDLNAFEATEEGDASVVPETNLYHTFSSDLDEPSDTPVTEPSGLSRSDDRDIILIDDAADDGASLAKPKQSVYGQLFAKLRRN